MKEIMFFEDREQADKHIAEMNELLAESDTETESNSSEATSDTSSGSETAVETDSGSAPPKEGCQSTIPAAILPVIIVAAFTVSKKKDKGNS